MMFFIRQTKYDKLKARCTELETQLSDLRNEYAKLQIQNIALAKANETITEDARVVKRKSPRLMNRTPSLHDFINQRKTSSIDIEELD